MGAPRWMLCIAVAACGKVDATTDAAIGSDGPIGCMGPNCIATGNPCTVATACVSGRCECHDATCATKVCSEVSCACQTTSDGAKCDGDVGYGHDDATDSCGADACDGTGHCGSALLWYRFDEPVGVAPTNSGSWPGTPTAVSGTLGAAGVDNTAIQLSTLTDGITINDPADGSLDGFAAWTVETWVNLAVLPQGVYATFIKKDGAYICRFVNGMMQGIIWTSAQTPLTVPVPTPATGTWYHAACTYSAGTLTLYWNGTNLGSKTGSTGSLADTSNPASIGNSASMGENLQGDLDDFQMWTTARDDRQICLDACGSYSGSTCTFDGVCGN